MTLFYSHHDVRPGSTGGYSIARALRRLGIALKTIHRAIAAAKIRQVRNELQRAKWARPHRPDAEADGSRFPRQPLHLGEKWDF